MTRRILLPMAALLLAGGAQAQQARTAVLPDSVTVGDVFRAAVRIALPAGAHVVFPDSLNDVPENIETAARSEIAIDSSGSDVHTATATFPLTAWRPGRFELPPLNVWLQLPDGGQTVRVTFPAVTVHSVLPADTAGIEPEPAKDVIGPNRLLWPLVLGAAAVAALLLLGIWLWRRRTPGAVPIEFLAPREAALAELERIRKLGLLEAGEWKPFYTAVTGVLRSYVDRIEPGWSLDLTTSELEREMERRVRADGRAALTDRHPAGTSVEQGNVAVAPVGPAQAIEPPGGTWPRLIDVLGRADLVKFANRVPGADDALQVWQHSVSWVETFAWPPPGTTATTTGTQEAA